MTVARGASAEGCICDICGRGMLAGEVITRMDRPSRRVYRRAICPLCRPRALQSDWVVSPTVPSLAEMDAAVAPPG